MVGLHIIEGVNVGIIALSLMMVAIVLPFKLEDLIPRASRWAASIFFITIAIYLGWIAGLFFGDKLATLNYSAQLVTIRALAALAGVWFVIAVVRCDGNLYAAKKHD